MLSLQIFPFLPLGPQQGFNTLGITPPQQLGFNSTVAIICQKREPPQRTQAKDWDHDKDEGHSGEKNP